MLFWGQCWSSHDPFEEVLRALIHLTTRNSKLAYQLAQRTLADMLIWGLGLGWGWVGEEGGGTSKRLTTPAPPFDHRPGRGVALSNH